MKIVNKIYSLASVVMILGVVGCGNPKAPVQHKDKKESIKPQTPKQPNADLGTKPGTIEDGVAPSIIKDDGATPPGLVNDLTLNTTNLNETAPLGFSPFFVASDAANVPAWALQRLTNVDRSVAQQSIIVNSPYATGRLFSNYKAVENDASNWAWNQGWITRLGWLSFGEVDFLKAMIKSDEKFQSAMMETGIELFVPVEFYVVTVEDLADLDARYAVKAYGEMRGIVQKIRNAMELGVDIEVGETCFNDFALLNEKINARYPELANGQ